MAKKTSRLQSLIKNHQSSLKIFLIIFILLAAWFSFDQYIPFLKVWAQEPASASTQIYSADGVLLYETRQLIRKRILSSQEIPDLVKRATLNVEDRDFYFHFGIEPKALIRAAAFNLKHGGFYQGGSTLTMQLAKVRYLSLERTLGRKIKEIFLAIQLESLLSKNEILTTYLNEVPYGSNAYGIAAAADLYFGKTLQELNLAELATLVALPKAPTGLSPYGAHRDQLIERRNFVLDRLVSEGVVTKKEAQLAKASPLVVKPPENKLLAPHFVIAVLDEITEKFGEDATVAGGLVIKTNLNYGMQMRIEKIVAENKEFLKQAGATNLAVVVLDPRSGEVLSMIGSVDFYDSGIDGQVNNALALRQPGSAIKPIVYAKALTERWSPASIIADEPVTFGNRFSRPYSPRNYDGRYHGLVSLREALANSLNIPAVKLLSYIGVNQAIAQSKQLGINSLGDKKTVGLSMVLGGGEVKLLELAGSYQAFANAGIYRPATMINRITQDGKVLFNNQNIEARKVFDPAVAWQIADILSDEAAREMMFGRISTLSVPGHKVAVKTGTSSDYRDAWTIGFTPNLVVGVWVGNADGRPLRTGSAGAMAAAPVWQKIMTELLAGQSDQPFYRPENLSQLTVLTPKGYLTDWFTSWQINIGKVGMVYNEPGLQVVFSRILPSSALSEDRESPKIEKNKDELFRNNEEDNTQSPSGNSGGRKRKKDEF